MNTTQLIITIVALSVTNSITILALSILYRKYRDYFIKSQENNCNLPTERNASFIIRDDYTIVDLIFESELPEPKNTISEAATVAYIKENAAKYFIEEMEAIGALNIDIVRKPYHIRPNTLRIVTKIALKDE